MVPVTELQEQFQRLPVGLLGLTEPPPIQRQITQLTTDVGDIVLVVELQQQLQRLPVGLLGLGDPLLICATMPAR